jgi:hypothetical protein
MVRQASRDCLVVPSSCCPIPFKMRGGILEWMVFLLSADKRIHRLADFIDSPHA